MKVTPQSQKILEAYQRLGLIEAEDTDGLAKALEIQREPVLRGLRDFRKKQQQDSNWRKHRWKYMRGIKKWHKSFDGKRFHRALGTYLATRITRHLRDPEEKRPSVLMRAEEALQESSNAFLVSLSSIKTHLYLEKEYSIPVLEQALETYDLIDYAIPLLQQIEQKAFLSPQAKLTEEELELLLRLVSKKALWEGLARIFDRSPEEIRRTVETSWRQLLKVCPYTHETFMQQHITDVARRLYHG